MVAATPGHEFASLVRHSVWRRFIALAVSTAILVVVIILLGDLRRATNAESQAKQRARDLTDRLAISPDVSRVLSDLSKEPMPSSVLSFDYLSSDSAITLRDAGMSFVVARSVPIRRVLLPSGRAVVIYQAGAVRGTWLTDDEVDLADRGQATVLQQRSPVPPRDGH